MDIGSFFAITVATLVLVATPGPVVIATVARSAVGGFAAVIPFLCGVLVADLIYAGLAVSGLIFIAKQYGPAFLLIKYVGAAYLVYLGIQTIREAVFSSPSTFNTGADDRHDARESIFTGWLSGLIVTLGNPKLILFYVSFLPTFVDLTALSKLGAAFTAGWVAFLFFAGNLVWALVSSHLGTLLKTSRSLRTLKFGSGSVLAGAGVAVAVRD